MDPRVWGPDFWRSIHLAALAYPTDPTPEEAATYRAFFISLGGVLPCPSCRVHYQQHLDKLPIDPYLQPGPSAPAPTSLFAWTVAVHNEVNMHTGKRPWALDEAFATYMSAQAMAASSAEDKDGLGAALQFSVVMALATAVVLTAWLVLRVAGIRVRFAKQ